MNCIEDTITDHDDPFNLIDSRDAPCENNSNISCICSGNKHIIVLAYFLADTVCGSSHYPRHIHYIFAI